MAQVYLPPTSTVRDDGWTIFGTSIWDAVNDPQNSPDDNATFNRWTPGSAGIFQVGLAPLTPDILAINWVQIVFRSMDATGGGSSVTHMPHYVIGGVQYNDTPSALPFAFYTTFLGTQRTVNPATGAPWTKNILNPAGASGGFIIGIEENGTVDWGQCTQLGLLVDYRPVPSGLDPVRNLASQIVRRRRAPILAPKITVPCNELLDLEIGDNASLIHEALGAAGGGPAGVSDWKKHLVQVRRRRINPNNRTVEYTLWQQRGVLATFWFGAQSKEGSVLGQGSALLGTGGQLVYLRNSPAWYENPATGLVERSETDDMAFPAGGVIFEGQRTNLLTRSSAVSGTTGLTVFTGTNGASAVAEGNPPSALFKSDVTPNALRMIYGTVGGGSGTNGFGWADTASVLANTRVTLGIDHMETGILTGGDETFVQLRRLVDSFTWNNSTRAWAGGAAIQNALPLRTIRARDYFRDINVGGSNTTLRLNVWQLATGVGTASRINRVYHAQLEDGPFPTSRIVTDAAAVVRATVTLTAAHTSAKPVIRNAGFSFHTKYTPLFNRSEVLGYVTVVPLFHLRFGASNAWLIRYNVTDQRFELVAVVGGVSFVAYSTTVVVSAGTQYQISGRATSSAGEYGTAYNLTIFVNEVKGTDAVRSGDPAEASVNMNLGGDSLGTAALSSAYGQLTPILFTQEVLSDDELARFAYA